MRALLPIIAALAVAACSSGPTADFDNLVTEYCACADAACASKVMTKIDAFGEKMREKSSTLSDQDKKQLAASAQRMLGCKDRIEGTNSVTRFNKYMTKSKTTEARQFIKRMADGARSYYMSEHVTKGSMAVSSNKYPTPSVGPTPPLGTCCQSGGKCEPKADRFSAPTWIALSFSVDDPHYYSYEYRVSDDGTSFTTLAYGDLDCDGVYSTFSIVGQGEEIGLTTRIKELE